MPRSHQHFRPVPTMKLLGIMNRCWSTTFHIVATKVPMDGARSGRCQCVCLTKFIWHSTSNPKCHVMFSKTKKNVNWHLNILLKCHLNVTCLVVRVISIFKVPIDVWFFLCTSHTTKSKSKLCVLIDVHFIFLCKFLHVECKKLNVKNTHWPAWSAPPVSIIYIYIYLLVCSCCTCKRLWKDKVTLNSGEQNWNLPWETVLVPAFFRARPEATSSQPCWSWGKKFSTTRAHRICRMQYHDNPRNLTNFKRTKSVCDLLKEAGSLKPELDLYRGR